MALALYRRYRPDTFSGVIGQTQVTEPLIHALDEHRLTHAYLFSGPRGCGKTSSARILARCVNCAQGPTSQPCGVCDSCKDLATGGPGSIDVVEIDAASHNGVDDARELRERAGFAPARDRYKIFILDEAHMVTQQGFNALLKIVEEPPEHVMFIFATTEPDKVIGTIRSRTHHYPFRLVPPEIMGPYLEEICQREEIDPQPGVLKLAMRAGGGSVRDTLSVLDQLMVGAVDGAISYDAATALLGFTPDVLIGEAFDAIVDHDGAALYGVIQKVIVGGFDSRRFVEDLLARARDLLILTLGGANAERALGDDDALDLDGLRSQAQALGLPMLTAMAETMDDALAHMAGAISPRMRLELLAAKLLALRERDFTADTHQGGTPGDAPRPQARGGFVGASGGSRQAAAPAPAQQAPAAGTEPARGASQTGTGATDAPASAAQSASWPGTPRQAAAGVPGGSPAVPAVPSPQPAPGDATQASPAEPTASSASSGSSGSWPAMEAHGPAAPAQGARGGNPDQLWDGLVAQLPADVALYVDRTKVPRVHLSQDARTGRGRLWIKFDTPMSKYAFALAQGQEPVDGTTSVVGILRAAVHRVFGEGITLAPTEHMADGQSAPPFGRLPEDQQQRIKQQLLQESLQAKVAAMGAAREPQSHATQDGDAASQDGDAVHRAGPSDDPWAAPARQASAATAPGRDAPAAPVQGAPAQAVSPWDGTVAGSALPQPAAAQAVDPWGLDEPMARHIDFDRMASMDQEVAQAAPAPAPVHWAPAGPGPAAGEPGAAPQGAPAAAPARPGPQVDPDEDEYSMSDESLGSATAMSLEEVQELFEVKKVEDFAADDPHNPRNQQRKAHAEH